MFGFKLSKKDRRFTKHFRAKVRKNPAGMKNLALFGNKKGIRR